MSLRRVEPADEALLLKWVNDPVTRANAVSTEQISASEHREWFAETLRSEDRRMYIALEDGERVGQIRFDRTSDAWEVDVSVAPTERGHGLGVAIIKAGVRQLMNTVPDARCVRAVVRPSNAASLAAFGRAGFRRRTIAERRGVQIVVLERRIGSGTTFEDK